MCSLCRCQSSRSVGRRDCVKKGRELSTVAVQSLIPRLRYCVAFTVHYSVIVKCAVCLQIRDIQDDDLSDVLLRDENEVGEEKRPKTCSSHFKSITLSDILLSN